MAIEAAKLIVEIAADTKNLVKGLGQADSTVGGFAKKMVGAGAVLTAAVTGPALLAAKGMLDVAMAMEQSEIAFTTMLKSGEKASAFLNELRDFASSTPFEFTELQDAAKRMLAFGFASEDVLPMLRDIGDAASGLGIGAEGVDRITLALGQMQAKSKVSAQEMMQLTEAGIPAWGYLAEAMGMSTAEVMKLSERGLIPAEVAIQAILAGAREDFGGMMAKQAETAAGQISNLKDELGFLATDIGTMLLPAAKDMIGAAKDALTWWTALPEATQSGLLKVAAAAMLIGPAATAIGALAGALSALPGILAGVSAGFAAWRAGMTLTTALGAAGLSPIAIGLGAVALAAGAVALAWAAWNKNINETNKAGKEAVSGTWKKFFDDQISSGKSAADVLSEYRSAQARVNTTLQETPFYLRMFIKDQEGLKGSTDGLNAALAQAATTYTEYARVANEAGLGTDMLTESAWEAARANEALAETTGLTAETGAAAQQSAADMAAAYEEQAAAAEAARERQQALTNQIVAGARTQQDQLNGLVGQYEDLQKKMESWVKDAAGQVVNMLGQKFGEASEKTRQAMGVVDEVMGTNYLEQAQLKDSLALLIQKYGETGNLAEFEAGLKNIKEQGLAGMKEELEGVAEKAEALYKALLELPKEIQIEINFDMNGAPQWLVDLAGQNAGLGGEGEVDAEANGGPVFAGTPYIVGERGPELFVPTGSGTIVPNDALGGGVTIENMVINSSAGNGRELFEEFKNYLDAYIRENRNSGRGYAGVSI